MEIFLADTEIFFKANPDRVGVVSDPIMLDKGFGPTAGGLLSTEIFGNTAKERSRKFGVIDLNGYYLQPYVYKVIKRLDKRIDGIISGKLKVSLDKNGYVIEDPENGGTGLSYLYTIWDKLKFEKNKSSIRNSRIDIFENYKKNECFTKYTIVSPAMYRDINLQNIESGKVSRHEINTMYSKLLRLVAILKSDVSFSSLLNSTRYSIQLVLVEIYNYYKSLIEKKNGIFRKDLLGKSLTYGARVVISSPLYNHNSYKDVDVDFYHVGVPLALCCSLFTPFILAWVRNHLEKEMELVGTKYMFKNPDGSVLFKPLKDPMSYYNESKLQKMLDNFIHSYSDRFEKILLPTEDMDTNPRYMKMMFTDLSRPNPVPEPRELTLTDLFYQAASEVCRDKHVYVTRYPLTDSFSVFPIGIHVMSTNETVPMEVFDIKYKNYPKIDFNKSREDVSISFVDTVRMSNVYLSVLGGDYDGDQISIKGVFTQSANQEAHRILHSKSNIIGIGGDIVRKTTNETVQTLYAMTKFKNK